MVAVSDSPSRFWPSELRALSAGLQGVVGVSSLRHLQNSRLDLDRARDRIGKAQRAGAALLAVTVIAMVLARYV
jgi:hypothetical protein